MGNFDALNDTSGLSEAELLNRAYGQGLMTRDEFVEAVTRLWNMQDAADLSYQAEVEVATPLGTGVLTVTRLANDATFQPGVLTAAQCQAFYAQAQQDIKKGAPVSWTSPYYNAEHEMLTASEWNMERVDANLAMERRLDALLLVATPAPPPLPTRRAMRLDGEVTA